MRVSYFHPLLDFLEGHTWPSLTANIWTRQRRTSFDQNLLIVWKFMFESDAHNGKVRARINVRTCAVVLIGHGSQDILPVNFQTPLYKPLLFCFQLRHKTLDYCFGSLMLFFTLSARFLFTNPCVLGKHFRDIAKFIQRTRYLISRSSWKH